MQQYYPLYFNQEEQKTLVCLIKEALHYAPLFIPTMPKTGKLLSVRMSNCGELGWVSDQAGYRYQPHHPVTNQPWPAIPHMLFDLWDKVTSYPAPPQACLINWYEPAARMGLHQDRDEEDLTAPVVSISLGDDARFRIGGIKRTDPTTSVLLHSGDVLVLQQETRLAFHGIDKIMPGTSLLLEKPGRINLTLRRVTISSLSPHPELVEGWGR